MHRFKPARLKNAAHRLREERDGSFAVMIGVAAGVVMLAAGFSLNTVQLALTRSNLVNALDAAVTSTARDLTTGKILERDARANVEAFLFANGTRAFATADRLSLDRLVVDPVASTVSASASVDVDLVFPLFGAANVQKVQARSDAIYSDKKIEIAMMLDITGSMAGTKIEDLKTAAKNAVSTFLKGQDTARPRVRIALVPYADAVNTGALANVVYVESGRSAPSEPPGLNDARPVAATAPDKCATDREGDEQFSDAGPETAMVNRDYRLSFCPGAALKPLSADMSALHAAIDAFSAKGNTAGQIGIQFSWYMLSPQWAGVLPEASRPAAFDPKKVAKYAILMTDGEFNTAFAGVDHADRRGNPINVRNQPAKSREYAERLCAEMKRQGIEIFTVGFDIPESAKAAMRNCASPDRGSVRHYFDASTGAELDDAYQTIASNIERLALTW